MEDDENQPSPPANRPRANGGSPQTSPLAEHLSNISLEDEKSPGERNLGHYEEASTSGLRGIPLFRQTEPIVRHHETRRTSVPEPEEDFDHSDVTSFTHPKNESPTPPSSPRLRSVLKSTPKPKASPSHPDAAPNAPKEKGKVSFSTHDEILLCDVDEALAEAQQSWKVCRRTSRASQQEQDERDFEEALEKASAYPVNSRSDLDPFSCSLIAVSDRGRAGPSTRAESRASYSQATVRGFDRLPRMTAVGRRSERQRQTAESRALNEKKHHHKHGYTNCQHQFTDPMDCTCDDPDVVIEAEGECKECSAAKTQPTDDDDEPQTERDEFMGWLKKLGRKMAS
ncbi:hypothetical protein TWF696_007515 [Orbilia brochopaga]|uniref:Uncharacterized protein n=1 Tax=Orbilia brochopaga TaxID=3140254 RepID=A0AAV9UMR3_9PEZI